METTTISKTDDGVKRTHTFAWKTDNVGVYKEFVQNDNGNYHEYTSTVLYIDEDFYINYLCRNLACGEQREGNYR